METYVCLLRGVNVGGKNKLPMRSFRNLLTGLGLQEVETYIQSGNAVFRAEANEEELATTIAKELSAKLHLDCTVLVYAARKFMNLCQWPGSVPEHAYYVFLEDEPDSARRSLLEEETYANETLILEQGIGYLHCKAGMGRAKLNNGVIEKKLGVAATTRNHKTVLKLTDLCQTLGSQGLSAQIR